MSVASTISIINPRSSLKSSLDSFKKLQSAYKRACEGGGGGGGKVERGSRKGKAWCRIEEHEQPKSGICGGRGM